MFVSGLFLVLLLHALGAAGLTAIFVVPIAIGFGKEIDAIGRVRGLEDARADEDSYRVDTQLHPFGRSLGREQLMRLMFGRLRGWGDRLHGFLRFFGYSFGQGLNSRKKTTVRKAKKLRETGLEPARYC